MFAYLTDNSHVVGLIGYTAACCEGIVSQDFTMIQLRMPTPRSPQQLLCAHTTCMRSIMINGYWVLGA